MIEIINETEKVVTIKIQGTIEMLNVIEHKSQIEPIMAKDKSIIFDMKYVDYIDSTGVGFLLGVLKRQRAKNKKTILGNLNDNVKNILKVSSLYGLFDAEDDE